MNATEIVAKEQVLMAVLKMANAELADALERRERLTKQEDIQTMDQLISDFRINVIKKIQDKFSELHSEMQSLAGITKFNWTL